MKIEVFDIPEEAKDLAPWLERQLMGTRLRSLVAEIRLFLGNDSTSNASLQSILGNRLSEVLEEGLLSIPESSLRQLIASPTRLEELQDLILETGGDYWRTVETTTTHTQQNQDVKKRVLNSINDVTPIKRIVNTPLWAGLAALAALILILFSTAPWIKDPGEFFASEALQSSELTGKAYLALMADEIERDWKTPTPSKDQFKRKLTRLRDSCDVITSSPLKQLETGIADDLRKRCQKWQADFTIAIADIEAGKPLREIQERSDAVVEKLIRFLRG